MLDAVLLVVGFVLLLGGGDLLVRGASALAKTVGISPLIIGLTIVAFGTSAPELAVNMLAALQGNGAISFGNIVGSNIANIALILGCAALLRPIAIEGSVITREIPMMLLASAAALVLGFDGFLRGATDHYDRADGLVFLLFFAVFLYYTISEVLQKREEDPFVEHALSASPASRSKSLVLNAFMVLGGFVALLLGGKLTVDAAVALATLLGVPKVVIGLTLVAVGTSLPELVTSVIATWRGQSDIAVGNVVGSNIFNLLFIMGLSAFVSPVPVPAGGGVDLWVMLALSVLLLPLALRNRRQIGRGGGVFLLFAYGLYIVWRSGAIAFF
ncbi:calcium/sodium antiporter [Thiovibrio sp. JS02]